MSTIRHRSLMDGYKWSLFNRCRGSTTVNKVGDEGWVGEGVPKIRGPRGVSKVAEPVSRSSRSTRSEWWLRP